MPYKVLLIDDSRMLCRDLEVKFRSFDFKIITAASWQEGRQLLPEISPDTLILDYHLQGTLTAQDCLKDLQNMGKTDIPVILISADPTSIKKTYAHNSQVLAYLSKPVRPAEIEKVLGSLLAIRKDAFNSSQTGSLPTLSETERRYRKSLEDCGLLYQLVKEGYTFLGKIGSGGVGRVYKLRQESLGREVVLKVLAEKSGSDSIVVKRFVREAKVLATLSHPNLLIIYDYGARGEFHYILMEHVEGKTLRDYLRGGRPSMEFILKVMFDLCNGLGYIHKKNMVHRDLKPLNIMVSRDRRIKIIDFGLAKALDDPETQFSTEGVILGTPEYMSPEQAMGFPADQRSDIYSLGIILYEMLAGTPPFRGDFPEEVIYKQRNCEHVPLRKLDRRIRQSISNIVDKMISKNPDHRFQAVEELQQRLRMEKYLEERARSTTKKRKRKEGEEEKQCSEIE